MLGATAALALTVAAQAGAKGRRLPFSASFSGAVALTGQATVALDGAAK